jgi:ADP-ribose pyrophosphatase YjhB (NUDIX family)
MSKHNICNNCGKQGHQFHQCKLPITSFGIILCRPSPNGIQYLMIRRKNSFGYIDFIRGKYIQNNVDHLKIIFEEMSIDEREAIRTQHFTTLWKNMWNIQDTNCLSSSYKAEELSSQKKFESLKNGSVVSSFGDVITIDGLLEGTQSRWKETEWEFAKGRRNYQERDLDCALREFEEETGMSKLDIKIVENLAPFEEIFIGSNHKSYKHKYFLAYTENTEDRLNLYQREEVSKIEWKTLDECLDSIRPYHTEKKQLITKIDTILREYALF